MTQQVLDESECFEWARSQTGLDPLADTRRPQDPVASAQPTAAEGTRPARPLAGAAGGAVAGTAVGAVAGDAGKGAAIGAGAGLLGRARQARKAAQESQQKAQADAASQAQAERQAQAMSQQQRDTFGRAFGACMDGRGYTVR